MNTTGLYQLLDAPLYTGSTLSPDVPATFDVAIGGRAFKINRDFNSYGTRFKDASIELLRPQADNSSEPSEAGINPDATWVRSQHSWHHGAGQDLLDRKGGPTEDDADRERYRASKGIDVWAKGQLGLLKVTGQYLGVQPSVAGRQFLTVFGNNKFAWNFPGDGISQFWYFQNDGTIPGAWITAASTVFTGGLSTSPINGMTSDGFNVWAAQAENGIWNTNANLDTFFSAYVTTEVDGRIGYVKSRLMAASGPTIYNIIATGALPAALFTQANTDFQWVGFAEGQANIYAAGYSGHKSLVYRIAVTNDAATLDQPIVAGELPDGEIIHSIYGYLGFIFLGTSVGARFCTSDAQGNLTIGDAIETPYPVECFVGEGRYVWFGLTNYDSTSTGVGRMDIRTLADTGAQQLAWASDVVADNVQGTVWAVARFQGRTVFAVDASGIWVEGASNGTTIDELLESSGQITTGMFDYGLVPDKVTTSIDTRYGAGFVGSVACEIAADGGDWQMIGYQSNAGQLKDNFETRQARGSKFELRFTLTRSATATTTGPELAGWVCNAEPTGSFREQFLWVLLIAQRTDANGVDDYTDPQADVDYIKELHRTRSVVTCQIGKQLYQCVVTDYQFWRESVNRDGSWNGDLLTWLKRVAA